MRHCSSLKADSVIIYSLRSNLPYVEYIYKNSTESVRPYLRDAHTNKQTNRQTDKNFKKYIFGIRIMPRPRSNHFFSKILNVQFWLRYDFIISIDYFSTYFGPKGLEYNLIRVPIAGCDFSEYPYTYAETPWHDTTLSNFSLSSHDYFLKVISKQIRRKIYVTRTWRPRVHSCWITCYTIVTPLHGKFMPPLRTETMK